MKKIFLFFAVIFLTISSANAARQDSKSKAIAPAYEKKEVCVVSAACKKLCDEKIDDNLEKATPEQQKFIIQCAQDMMKKYNLMTQGAAGQPDL